MRIIKTPWKNELLELVSKSQKSIKITSPFVKENICNDLLLAKPANTKLELITSFKLMNLYSGSLDLKAIEKIIQQNGVVRNHPKLHSKLYIFDDEKMIIIRET
jgi:phosphatidylserine/phosphatidylglycerophosphate/cardiolipin synthase-like enzyme